LNIVAKNGNIIPFPVVPVIPHENEILADDTQPCHENDDEN